MFAPTRNRRGVRPAHLLALGFLALAASGAARSQELRDLVEEVLDQRAENVQVDGLPMPEALARLGEKTGLSFVMDPAAMDAMPYGERTKVSLDLREVTLRQGLQRMFDGLGLAMRLEADKLVVERAPVLDRLGRRMTINEVHLLSALASKLWSELPESSRLLQFRAVTSPNPQSGLESALAQTRAPNALRQLEAATQNLGWCWVPQEDALLVYSRAEDLRQRLERPMDLNYQGVPLDEVLIDLGNRVGVTVSFQAGVLERIQARQRRLDLIHRHTTVLQTLERLCGTTGTKYAITDTGILITLPEGQTATARAPAGRIVALLRVPVGADGTYVEFPFYEDTLPPEFRNLLEQKLPVVLEELRQREGR